MGTISDSASYKHAGVTMFSRKAIVLFVLLTVIFVGCGGSPDIGTGQTQSVGPGTATVTLRLSDTVARTLDSSINGIRLRGLDGTDEVVFGPVNEERRAEQSWEMSTSVERLILEFLVDERVVGVYSVGVDLRPGQNLVIEDPDFLDAASPLASLQVQSDGTVFPLEFNPRLSVLGTFEDSSTADLSGVAAWSVLENQLADIDSTGLLSPKVAGQVTVRAEALDVSDELVLTITDARLSSVRVEPESFKIAAATGTFQTAKAVYNDGTVLELRDVVNWSSDLEAIARVDQNGKVFGLVPGIARISAAYRGRVGTSVGTISSATLVALIVTPPNATVADGGTAAFEVEGQFSDDTTQDLTHFVTWGSANSAVASVNASGVATGLGPGQALVIATDFDETMMASGTLTVTSVPDAPSVATTLVFSGAPGSVGHGATLNPVSVSVLDQFGRPMPGATGTVTLSLQSPPALPSVEQAILAQMIGSQGSGTIGSGTGDTGSGSGEPTGSGSGEPTGGGSGEPTGSGSGSGQPTGSGSGSQPPNPDTGPNGETGLVGTLSKPLVNGTATFDDLVVYTAGTYVLRAGMGGAQGSSNIFIVTFP